MKTYKRILIPATNERSLGAQLHSAATLGRNQTEIRILHVLDARNGIEPDGPAGNFPGERESRRVMTQQRRLELQLARGPLAGALARVVSGQPAAAMAEELRDWKPDLVVTAAPLRPALDQAIRDTSIARPDILEVAETGWMTRLVDAFRKNSTVPPAPTFSAAAQDT